MSHHGTSDNQRDYRTVQLQTEHSENALGRKRQLRQRQEQEGARGKLRVGKHQGADNEALPTDFRPRGIRDGRNGTQRLSGNRYRL